MVRRGSWASNTRSARPTRAHLDASVARWNIDSPANSPPKASPYSPPTSSPSRHASTEWAHPSSYRRVYAAVIAGVIQDPSLDGSAQPATTSENAVSTRMSKRRNDLRKDRLILASPGNNTPRGSGDHQPVGALAPSPRPIGNNPAR